MSTRATITVADQHDSFDFYQHHDGYPDGPHGLVRHIAMARRLAWDLPRFEAGDFAAAIIAVLKDRGGSTFLTKDADAHGDRSFHYHVSPLQETTATRVMLTITRPSWERGKEDVEVFAGDIQEAVAKFDAVSFVANPFVVVLDANVLFPFRVRDVLLTFAQDGLFRARITDEILDEWT